MIEETWFEGLPTRVIGRKVLCFKKVTSTNDLAWLEIFRGAAEGTVIFADEQLKGRGRFGRSWFAPRGGGLWFSIVLKPQISPEHACLLMVIGAIAICELLREKYQLPASIRWPNDVIINNKKVAGIIVEARYLANTPEAMVVGIGFNANLKETDIPQDLIPLITSLSQECKRDIEEEPLVKDLLISLDNWYDKIRQKEYEVINRTWQEMSGVLNHVVIVKTADKEITGTVVSLDACTGISIKTPDGQTHQFRGENVESLRLK
jgi:BirA family biotin operon repressor/biotin-[acetyl-CoA-carboxylase] ligase